MQSTTENARGRGALLVQLGTPDAPTTPAVRRYLREFLSDPHVLDIAPPARFLLASLVIAPFRAPRSAAAYRAIWTAEGSPLLVHSRALARGVADRLEGVAVELGMRYGEPALEDALARLLERGCEEIVCLPLYPQRAQSSTATATEAVERAARRLRARAVLRHVPPFHADEGFLDAFEAVARASLVDEPPQRVLFSFHGLPERHVRRADPTGERCLVLDDCCAELVDANRDCYRAQCHATARALAGRLELEPGSWSVAFQSRLGRTPWIRPYTDEVLPAWAAGGVRRVAVLCPAFVADCLETLEEIGIRARASFLAAGGEELSLVPSLNASPRWVETVADLIERASA